MQSLLSQDEVKELMEAPQGPCVSLYLPTHRAGAETQQDPIRLKNLLREAEDRLAAMGLRATEARELLAPVYQLLPERPFWQHQEAGLAIFRAPELFRCYRLPLTFPELVVVTDRFHLKPLLPLLTEDTRFYLLALSQNEVRLFHGTRLGLHPLDLPEGVPVSLAEALRDDDPEKQLQFHTGTSGGSGERPAVFHGHGVGTDDAKENLRRYFQQVDRGLHDLLREEHAPLLLAGVEYLLPIYQEANTYPHLVADGVRGNPEGLRPEELHDRAWTLIEPHFRQAQQNARDRYQQLAGTPQASCDVREIVPAAVNGRVEQLFVAIGVQQWGRFEPATQTVHLHPEAEPGDEDLLDLAALQTFLNGGTVYAVAPQEVPAGHPRSGSRPLAAVLRY